MREERCLLREGGGGVSTKATGGWTGRRVICSIDYELIEEAAHANMSCLCDVRGRSALGFVGDTIRGAKPNATQWPEHRVNVP